MRYAIVGNGVAGNTAALALGKSAPEAQIDLYSAEAHPYYPRPLLPEFLAGAISLESLYFKPISWYASRGVTLHVDSAVEAIWPAEHRLRLRDGSDAGYDRLLLATGGTAWVPPIPGSDQPGVCALRTIDDALRIQALARQAWRAVVIGGGLLGLETARALRDLGLHVTIVECLPRLLPRQLDDEGAAVLQGLIEGPSTQVLVNASSQQILGDGKATGLRLTDGRELAADLVVVSAGMRSDTRLAHQAGLSVARGVVADGQLRTSAPDIWAAGDAAEFSGRVYGIVPAAIAQARVAAASMAGEQAPDYAGTIPSTTLKVSGIDLTSVGSVMPEEGHAAEFLELRRADPEKGRYRKLVLKDGRLVGAILLGDRANVGPVTQLINQRADLSAHIAQVMDDDFAWKSLL
jgi:nitrite reductase (NADH) large subunit